MTNLTLLVVGIMIIPAVIGGAIFALNDKEKNPYPKFEARKTSYEIPVWPDGYVFERIGGNFAWDENSFLDKMYRKLEMVDKKNPQYRERDGLDEWFDRSIDVFCRHSEFLAYIAKYGYITDRFMQLLHNPENNLELQKNLVSVVHYSLFDSYHLNCQNLLFYYLKSYDLASEIKKTIAEDARFIRVKEMYERQHGKLDSE
ncbi:MAG: hypothetical protein IJ677_06675 [Alphaproteobacteria bacterium]|nr:hypothetical protein [Alphaproteobacteria bacterium]